jgi:protease-4
MPSLSRPSTPEELARIQTVVDDIYNQFVTKVAESRRMSKDAVQEIAQGRVWSGREALKLGLVDEMGGLQDAVKAAAKLAKIENDYSVDVPEPNRTAAERFMKLLEGRGGHKVVQAGLGDQIKATFEHQIEFLNSLNDPQAVYARMPFDLSIR